MCAGQLVQRNVRSLRNKRSDLALRLHENPIPILALREGVLSGLHIRLATSNTLSLTFPLFRMAADPPAVSPSTPTLSKGILSETCLRSQSLKEL